MRFRAVFLLSLLWLVVWQSPGAYALSVCSGNLSSRVLASEFEPNLERVCLDVTDTIVVTYEVRNGEKLIQKKLDGTKSKIKTENPNELAFQNVREFKDGDYLSETITLYLVEKDRIRSEGAMAEFYEGNVVWTRMRRNGVPVTKVLKQLHYYASSAKPIHWSYHGETGPQKWGELDANFETCEVGSRQSPISIETAKSRSHKKKLTIQSVKSALSLVNNGHTLQANVSGENFLIYDNKKYKLLQFHIHAPSEHEVDGKTHDLEIHFVHQAEDRSFAVLGVLVDAPVDAGKSELVQAILDQFPKQWNKPVEFSESVLPSRLISKLPHFFHYPGSLTTPPCSEGISWFVLKEPMQISKAQLAAVKEIVGGANARRPLAEIEGRTVCQNDGEPEGK